MIRHHARATLPPHCKIMTFRQDWRSLGNNAGNGMHPALTQIA